MRIFKFQSILNCKLQTALRKISSNSTVCESIILLNVQCCDLVWFNVPFTQIYLVCYRKHVSRNGDFYMYVVIFT